MTDIDSVKGLIARIEMDACPGFGDLSNASLTALEPLKALVAEHEAASSTVTPNLFWIEHVTGSTFSANPHDLAEALAESLGLGESKTVRIKQAQALPDTNMKVNRTPTGAVTWQMVTEAGTPDQSTRIPDRPKTQEPSTAHAMLSTLKRMENTVKRQLDQCEIEDAGEIDFLSADLETIEDMKQLVGRAIVDKSIELDYLTHRKARSFMGGI